MNGIELVFGCVVGFLPALLVLRFFVLPVMRHQEDVNLALIAMNGKGAMATPTASVDVKQPFISPVPRMEPEPDPVPVPNLTSLGNRWREVENAGKT